MSEDTATNKKEETTSEAAGAGDDSSSASAQKASQKGAGKAIGVLIILALIALGGLQAFGVVDFLGDSSTTVATVNGEVITRGEFDARVAERIAALEAQGIDTGGADTRDILETQVLENIVTTRLILQEAEDEGVVIEDEAIETEYETVAAQVGDDAAFQEALAANGLTESTLRRNIREQLTVRTFLEASVDLSTVSVSDADVRALYDASIEGQAEDAVPTFEEVRAQLHDQLLAERQQDLIDVFIQELRDDAEIVIAG